MAKWADTGKEWQQPEPGNHLARCIRVIELGTQEKPFQGKVTLKKQTMIVWELPTELMDDGKPFTISQWYTASLNEKANLRRDLDNWRGRPFTEEELAGFDQRNILGKPCLLNVVLSEKGKAVVGTVGPVPKGMAVPPQVNPSLLYDIDEHSEEVWLQISPGIQRIILSSQERKAENVVVAAAAPAARPQISSTSPLSQAQRRLLLGDSQNEDSVEVAPQKAPPRKTRSKPQPQTTTQARFVDDVNPNEPVAADAIIDKDLPF